MVGIFSVLSFLSIVGISRIGSILYMIRILSVVGIVSTESTLRMPAILQYQWAGAAADSRVAQGCSSKVRQVRSQVESVHRRV
jgi:hypothetical protein